MSNISSFTDQGAKRRPCTRCKGSMMLTCIEPSKPGFDFRTFECQDCAYVEGFVVEIDLMQSGAHGWLSSHLHAPT